MVSPQHNIASFYFGIKNKGKPQQRDTDVKNRLLASVGEDEGGMI